MNRAGLAVTLAVATLAIVLIVWRTGRPVEQTAMPSGAQAMPAPDASSVTLGGGHWNLGDQRGKVVLLDFWATWCPPCVAAIPDLKAVYDKFKSNDDFILVGVSLDDQKSALESFVKRERIGWLQLFDIQAENEMAHKFNVHSIPTSFLIDRQGRIQGIDLSPAELTQTIDRLLKAPA